MCIFMKSMSCSRRLVPLRTEPKTIIVDLNLPAQLWQRGTKEGTVQKGAVVLDDFNQLVFGA